MKILKAKAEYQELSRLDFPYTGSQLMAADALLMAFERERCKELTSKITELNKKRQQ